MVAIESLFDAALSAQSRAYAPYSKFKVGAAISGASGHGPGHRRANA